jgi:8-oxo-dGTP pyrophosphatase MutT (NUDIX family)
MTLGVNEDLESPAEPRPQFGALPYRRRRDLEILLVTSRETRRWVLPKGWPMKRRTPQGAAAREALEEAGVKGDVAKLPFGSYHYQKRQPNGEFVLCRVDVFPLRVKRQSRTWPEVGQRTRRWFTLAEAIDAVDEPELKALIERFGLQTVAERAARRAAPQQSDVLDPIAKPAS